MNYYISDLHFGHANVIRHDNRPFADVEEMDRALNVGAPISGYRPVTFDELLENNRRFNEREH